MLLIKQVSKVCVCTSQRESQVTYKRGEKTHQWPSGGFGSGKVVEMDQHCNTDGENFCRVTRTCKNVDFSREELLKRRRGWRVQRPDLTGSAVPPQQLIPLPADVGVAVHIHLS